MYIRKFIYILPTTCILLLISLSGFCMDGETLSSLKKAGVSDLSIQMLLKEKSLETGAVTPKEILDLRKSGISDQTLQLFLRENSFIKNREPLVYGDELRSIRLTTIKDIMK